MPKSLSTFLEECRREIPNEVIHISKPVDPAHYDATAHRQLKRITAGPAKRCAILFLDTGPYERRFS